MAAQPARTPADTALVLDAMVGKLATYLRMCGYDAAYALDRTPDTDRTDTDRTDGDARSGIESDDRLLAVAREEDRLLVTRDRDLAGRAGDLGLLLELRDVTDQLRELAAAGFALELSEPSRCGACNAELVELDADAPGTPAYAPDPGERRVWRCADCGRYYWTGSHWESVAETLDGL